MPTPRRYTAHPRAIATTVWTQIGKIAPGFETKSVPMMKAKTASTIQIRKEMISRKSVRARAPITWPAMSQMERPWLRRLITRAEKSWTAPIRTVPTATQSIAGSQPQITAMAGPTMGAAPAMDV